MALLCGPANCGDSAVAVHLRGRCPSCRDAHAVSHGPDCSSDHRDSPVARLQGGQCPCYAGCAGSSGLSWRRQLLPQLQLDEKGVPVVRGDVPGVQAVQVVQVSRRGARQFMVQTASGVQVVQVSPSWREAVHGPDCSSDHERSSVRGDVPVMRVCSSTGAGRCST